MSNLTLSASPALALPAGAMFHPKMLTIGPSTTRAEYQQLCAGLSKIDDASDIWVCDAALWGMQKYGREDGLELAHASLGYTKGTCKKLAYIAERFTPEHRPDGFTRAHFKALLPFPQDWLNTWLTQVSDRRLSASGIRALAVEQFGSDPSQRPTRKTRAIHIRATIFEQLRELNQTQPSALAEAIITAWLSKSPEEQSACLATASESKRLEKNERQRLRNAKKAERESAKAAARAKREAEQLAQKAERQKFYEAEAAEKLARKAEKEQRIAKQRAEKQAERIRLGSVKGIEPSLYGTCKIGKVTKFYTLDEAAEAAKHYSAVKNYPMEGFACEKCSHFHIRCDEVAFEAARVLARSRRNNGNESADVSQSAPPWDSSDEGPNRLPYDQRRAAQIASGAGEPIPQKKNQPTAANSGLVG